MQRYLYWFSGFVLLFVFNVIVEAVVLPAMDLDNTDKNDTYFQLWWVAVFLWLIFGLSAVDKLLARKQPSESADA